MTETTQQYVARILSHVGTRDPLDVLGTTARELERVIGGRSREALRWTTTPERWSCAAILAHLADAEIVASYRVRMILAAPGTDIQAFDQNAWAAAFSYADQDPFASLALFRTLREAWLSLVDTVDESWLDRYGMHQERGKESVRHLLRLYAGHDLNHLGQVVRLIDEHDRER